MVLSTKTLPRQAKMTGQTAVWFSQVAYRQHVRNVSLDSQSSGRGFEPVRSS
jgi:hypothetical protein